jgi:hypothetical protein
MYNLNHSIYILDQNFFLLCYQCFGVTPTYISLAFFFGSLLYLNLSNLISTLTKLTQKSFVLRFNLIQNLAFELIYHGV